jgi:hypothetical protein
VTRTANADTKTNILIDSGTKVGVRAGWLRNLLFVPKNWSDAVVVRASFADVMALTALVAPNLNVPRKQKLKDPSPGYWTFGLSATLRVMS